MRDAVIVSTARTPLTKAARGSFNNTLAPTLGAFSVKAAVERAGLEGGEIDDVLFGAAMQQGSQTMNIGRLVALRAGLPVSVPGMSIDRQCSSGLMTIATAAKWTHVQDARWDRNAWANVSTVSSAPPPNTQPYVRPPRTMPCPGRAWAASTAAASQGRGNHR